MQIIGAGFGRTGTMSLQAALHELGFYPTYHMLEVFKNPGHIKHWLHAAEGKPVDWKGFLGKYEAAVDYPVSAFYEELLAVYPDALVILTVRDPERWYESTRETIFKGTAIPSWLLFLLPPYRQMKKMVQTAIWDRVFQGRFEDREYAIQVFDAHIERVKAVVPPEKLLVYQVKEGWGPLCQFLQVPIPEKPFPHVNDRKTTQKMYLAARLGAGTLLLGMVIALAWLLGLGL